MFISGLCGNWPTPTKRFATRSAGVKRVAALIAGRIAEEDLPKKVKVGNAERVAALIGRAAGASLDEIVETLGVTRGSARNLVGDARRATKRMTVLVDGRYKFEEA